jgi:adenylylsulfate kinase-like enzyme
MILVLFGQPHSGKSTIANEFSAYHNIDGDKLRELFQNNDYSKEGRIKNLNRASDIAHYLHNQGKDIILSLVYPYKEARDYLRSLKSEVKFVYLTYDDIRGRENFHVIDFDAPTNEEVLSLNTSQLSIEECINKIKSYIYAKSTSSRE